MPKRKIDFVTDAAVRDYIRDVLKLHSSEDGLKEFQTRFNAVMAAVLKGAATLTKKARKKTILPDTVVTAFEKNVGKEMLDWPELSDQLMKLSAADLGKVSQVIRARLKKLEGK